MDVVDLKKYQFNSAREAIFFLIGVMFRHSVDVLKTMLREHLWMYNNRQTLKCVCNPLLS